VPESPEQKPHGRWASELGATGTCVYIAGLVVPVRSSLWLIVLAASGLLLFFRQPNKPFRRVPLLVPMLIFLAATALSILRSEDIGRSIRLSAPLVPALLLFILIADHFEVPKHTRWLYLTLSAAGLALSLEVLWNAWRKGWVIPPGWQNWLSDVRSPLLVVPNDTVFLAVIAPLSLAVLLCRSGRASQLLAAISILLSILAVSVIQSRIATVTIIASLGVAAALVRPRLAFVFGPAVLAVTLILDAALGFQLLTKFSVLWRQSDFWNGRIPIWSAAWTGFITSPILGHGPHTFDYVSPASIHLRWAHNLYLEILGEQGIIGLIALALLLYQVFSAASTNYHRNKPEVRYLGAGAYAALIGFCIGAVFELSFLREWVVIIFFSLLGVIAQLAWYKQQQEGNA
jgi:O-antigen ligase